MELVSRTELFPSLVYEIAAEELVDETVEILKQSNFPEETPYVTDTFYVLGKNPGLIARFEEKVNSALGEIEYAVPFRMTTSWFTCTPQNYPVHTHNHVNSAWSASFYFFNQSSPLHIVKGKDPIYVPFKTTNPKLMMSGTVSIPANKGKIILFPSHLEHYISKNPNQANRYSLAMNFMPDGLCSFYDSEYNYT
tara:strand:+ start:554 stop:1135 length:582 start_codon:yes stop_codon:yes gene_type:complete